MLQPTDQGRGSILFAFDWICVQYSNRMTMRYSPWSLQDSIITLIILSSWNVCRPSLSCFKAALLIIRLNYYLARHLQPFNPLQIYLATSSMEKPNFAFSCHLQALYSMKTMRIINKICIWFAENWFGAPLEMMGPVLPL